MVANIAEHYVKVGCVLVICVYNFWDKSNRHISHSAPQSEREAKASSFSPIYHDPRPNHPNPTPFRRGVEAPVRNNNNYGPIRRQSPIVFGNRQFSPNDVSETDLYLLSAIEKLVYRVDYLEKRVQKTDTLVLHLLKQINEDKQQQTHNALPPPISPTSIKPATTTGKRLKSCFLNLYMT